MANITIQQSPQEYTPAYEEITYVVSGTNTDQDNYKYYADVVVLSLIHI